MQVTNFLDAHHDEYACFQLEENGRPKKFTYTDFAAIDKPPEYANASGNADGKFSMIVCHCFGTAGKPCNSHGIGEKYGELLKGQDNPLHQDRKELLKLIKPYKGMAFTYPLDILPSCNKATNASCYENSDACKTHVSLHTSNCKNESQNGKSAWSPQAALFHYLTKTAYPCPSKPTACWDMSGTLKSIVGGLPYLFHLEATLCHSDALKNLLGDCTDGGLSQNTNLTFNIESAQVFIKFTSAGPISSQCRRLPVPTTAATTTTPGTTSATQTPATATQPMSTKATTAPSGCCKAALYAIAPIFMFIRVLM